MKKHQLLQNEQVPIRGWTVGRPLEPTLFTTPPINRSRSRGIRGDYDADGDGYGVSTRTHLACDQPRNYPSTSTDCDDTNKTIHPGASEICNSKVDDDCDGLADDADGSVSGQPTWYADSDGDTYGNSAIKSVACTAPASYVSNSTDCDDTDKNLNPTTQWYLDSDGDADGLSSSTETQCAQPASYVRTSGDRDDNAKAVNPKASETCNSIDDDCDTLIDVADTVTRTSTWYVDSEVSHRTMQPRACVVQAILPLPWM